MPNANQYTVTHRELLELLIQKCGVHEGKWTLLANFGFAAGNFGPTNEALSPGAVVVINNVGIQTAGPTTPAEIVLDAAVVNPEKKSSRSTA